MQRRVEPEILDELSPQDPAAVHSRADLRRLNRVMGHVGILCRALRRVLPADRSSDMLEPGCGDGSLLLNVIRKLPAAQRPGKAHLLDLNPSVPHRTLEDYRALGCEAEVIQADAIEYMESGLPAYDAILMNLFLHHFSPAQVQRLLAAASKCSRAVVALEPRRSAWGLFWSRLVGVIGCNRVTRHDAVVSVRAGFNGREISSSWEADGWEFVEEAAGPFSHLYIAQNKSGDARL